MITVADVRKAASKPASSPARKKKQKQPRQVNPKGIRMKILGANGKIRWEWS